MFLLSKFVNTRTKYWMVCTLFKLKSIMFRTDYGKKSSGWIHRFTLFLHCMLMVAQIIVLNCYQKGNNLTIETTATTEITTRTKRNTSRPTHSVAGLSCKDYGGPEDDLAAEMVYWRDVQDDASFVSPFKYYGPETKYLTFEPDNGGWNNNRMAMETAASLAINLGRTLVLPPDHHIPFLDKKEEGHDNGFNYKDFYHFDSVEVEYKSLEVISFVEFLNREAMTGQMKDRTTGLVSFPPGNRTDWDGFIKIDNRKKGIFPWIRNVSRKLDWDPNACVAGIPSEAGAAAAKDMQEIFKGSQDNTPREERANSYKGNPTAVDGFPFQRLRELLGPRSCFHVYDESMQQEKFLHLMGDEDSHARMLIHFYLFPFFQNWQQDLWTKRFIRNHIRYVDEIQCAAARIVHVLRERSKVHGNEGVFYSVHIRRGDFNNFRTNTQIDSEQILASIQDVVPANATLYIATDERDQNFFDALGQHYKIYFLDSFRSHLKVNSNFYGIIEQLVAARGKVFVGCYYSTFSGYINRLRGYHSQKNKLPGYEQGILDSYYYVPSEFKEALRSYVSPKPPYWEREFPIGWRDIDKNLVENLRVSNEI